MSVFDPLGFLAPFTLKSKILMQEVWRSGIGWDDQLRDEEHTGWIAWLGKLRDIRDYRIPRCITPKANQRASAQLHVFCDASLKAYAAAAYLRFEKENAQAHVMLVTAKSRIASLKPLSVPRLELQAALLGSRLAKSVEGELDIRVTRRIFWFDFMTIIRWIKSEPRTKQIFVAHRLGEIGELTETSEWHWVPSGQNPSDDATRWTDSASQSHERWVSGPQFLRNPETMWPKEKPLSETNKKSIDELETRKDFIFTITYRPLEFSLPLMILGWQGLLIIGRRVRNAFNRWRKKSSESISVESINAVEEYWYRVIQTDCFAEEIRAIKNLRPIHKGSKLWKLSPFLDEHGLLRVCGRATKIVEYEFSNNPIILDGKHPATQMLIKEYHQR